MRTIIIAINHLYKMILFESILDDLLVHIPEIRPNKIRMVNIT
ncbi:MAG: hypothetical protein ACI8XB_000463 [Patiriisocius sp.]|jgi:hypothetical protein